jgi:signal transduction histidine kinase
MGRFRNYLLPVPILPGYLAFIFFNLTTYGIVRFKTETEPVLFGWLRAWLEACIPAAVLAAFLYIAAHAVNFSLKKIRTARKKKYFYYIGLFIISLAYTLSQSLTDPDLPELSSRAYFRNFVHIFVAVSLIGNLYVNMRREIEEKMAALTLVQAQNKVLIESEERSRATVANFLHDRVQTALVTVTMQLSEIAKKISPTERSKVNSIIAEMEHIRGVDVRTAAQRLSPDLSVLGLGPALQLCVDALKPAIRSKIYISDTAKEWAKPHTSREHIHLGIYRIVEQATLNAAIHGRAKNVSIYIDLLYNQGEDVIFIDVINDGALVESPTIPGSGSAITAGWLSILGGTSDLSNTEDSKVKLHSEIPLEKRLSV